MKTLTILFALMIAVFSSLNGQTDTLTLIHINDTHSCIAPLGPRNDNLEGQQGGISRLASLVGMTRMEESNVLFLHSGDFFIGDFFFNKYFGAAELQILTALGLDALTLGNHEFDLTPAILDTALTYTFPASTDFPFLSANAIFTDPEYSHLAAYIKPYTIKQYGNMKVGIFGLTTAETNLLSQPGSVVFDTAYFSYSNDIVTTLQGLGCNVIICLSHLGMMQDQVLAMTVPGINIIIGGHDHLGTTEPVQIPNPSGKTTYIVQTEAFYKNAGKMKFTYGNQNLQLLGYTLVPLAEPYVPEYPDIKAVVDQLTAGIEADFGNVFTQQIGTATEYFEEVAVNNDTHMYDTPIGNLVTDAFRWKTGTEIAIEVGGSTCQPIYPGKLVAADLFRVVGYGFNTVNYLGYRICKFKIKGADLFAGLEFGVALAEYTDEYLPQVSGMSYSFDVSNLVGQRITSIIIGGNPINPDQWYSVTANEFLAFVLQQAGIIGVQINLDSLYTFENQSEYQVLAEYVMTQGTISPVVRGSVTSVKEIQGDGNQLPLSISLEQNYPNPFNPATTIKFELKSAGKVKLSVYDVKGELIGTLIDGEREAGSHQVSFNGSSLSSGIYFYILQADGINLVKKMTLLK